MLQRQISQLDKKTGPVQSSTLQGHDLAATVVELIIESKALLQPARATNSCDDLNEI
jgi:hypothetical protein